MTVMTDFEYENAILEMAKEEQVAFEPFSLLNEDGDCIEFFVSPKDYYAERVDDYLTVYIEEETGEVAGFVIKNITRILKRVAAQQAVYSFVIFDGEVRLEALFTVMLGNTVDQKITYVREYRKVVDIAKTHKLDRIQLKSILDKPPFATRASEAVSV